jgi:hypothetical protein
LDVAEFIEAEQVPASVAADDAGEDSFVGGFDEFVDELGGGDVADAASLFAGAAGRATRWPDRSGDMDLRLSHQR